MDTVLEELKARVAAVKKQIIHHTQVLEGLNDEFIAAQEELDAYDADAKFDEAETWQFVHWWQKKD